MILREPNSDEITRSKNDMYLKFWLLREWWDKLPRQEPVVAQPLIDRLRDAGWAPAGEVIRAVEQQFEAHNWSTDAIVVDACFRNTLRKFGVAG